MKFKLLLSGTAFAFLAGCATQQIPQAPQPTLEVITIPQPTLNILNVFVESEIVRVPTTEQTVLCNGCDPINAGVKQEDDVIWIKMTPIVEETIVDSKYFNFDKAKLKGDLSPLRLIAEKMKNDPTITANIVGYTDSIGSKSYNLKLGRQRANAVKNWLKSQGISTDRMKATSKGEANPVASNSTSSGRAKNRRAVITIHIVE
ncbi:OmpA family protein [Acinetobacter sp. ANC 5380]|uniref:OmpA family protein n=1 Tax=Acinetobacter terrae TaxID=2731247 RepID=A0A7Y2WCB6_9GAMM|nr:OmpA family protein [Acinetobacter terrae]NNH79205.1 OmpA family protein [Acinetobacter terrae]